MTTPEQWIIFGTFAAFAALVLLGAALAGAGRFGEMPPAVVDQFVMQLPDRQLSPTDLTQARFATSLRGYSPEQVDHLLHHAARQWQADRTPSRPSVGGSVDTFEDGEASPAGRPD